MNNFVKNIGNNLSKDCLFLKCNKKINLILDVGALNGIQQIGSLLLLKELEKNNKLIINKISGASIGSFTGLLYISDLLDKVSEIWDIAYPYYKKHKQFPLDTIIGYLKKNTTEDLYEKVKYKFYISYYDLFKGKKVVKYKYKSNEELFECVKRSCYLPFFAERTICYQNRYIDGLSPYIFKDNSIPIIRINLTNNIERLYSVVSIREFGNKNFHSRIINGIIEMNKFLATNENTEMCFYERRCLYNSIILKVRSVIELIILLIIIPMNIGNNYMKKNKNYSLITEILSKFGDLFLQLTIF